MADAITARNRRSIFGEGLVRIAIQPALTRLRRRDDRMSTLARVFAGVLIWRAVTAERDATCLARPQMDPGAADLHALFAFATLRLFDGFDCIQVRTASGTHNRLV